MRPRVLALVGAKGRLALAALLVACSGGDINVVDPDTTGSGGGGGGVQRGALDITVMLVPEDVATAASIGSPGGVLRGATLSLTRDGATTTSLVATTDSLGVARFVDLLPSSYTFSFARVLSSAEVAQLAPADADVTGFAGGGTASTSGARTAVTATAAAGRRGSLIISQIMAASPFGPDGNQYFFGQYLQVYNNSDTTIYLDGKLIARSINTLRDYPNFTCAQMAQFRIDPAGVWTKWIYAFPGAGGDRPLLPGQAAVIATDAIDHRAIVPALVDLARADFEFVGPSDVDNPSVPNMQNVGPGEWNGSVGGHGLYFAGNDVVFLVADRADPSTFARAATPLIDPIFWRIPTSIILDVFSSTLTPDLNATLSSQTCENFVVPALDRQKGTFMVDLALQSVVRKPFATLPGGRVILQRTRTTAQDFQLSNSVLPLFRP